MSTIESRLQQIREQLNSLQLALNTLKEDIDKTEPSQNSDTFTQEEVLEMLENAYETGFRDCYDEAMNTDYSLRYQKDVVSVEVEISGDEFFRYEPLEHANNKDIQVERILQQAAGRKLPLAPQEKYSIL